MYNDFCNAEGKIIAFEDLVLIFQSLNEILTFCYTTGYNEMQTNMSLPYEEQKWTFKDMGSNIRFIIKLADGNETKYEDYPFFLADFKEKRGLIKEVECFFNLDYSENLLGTYKTHKIRIDTSVTEKSYSTDFAIPEDEAIVREIRNLIKERINNSPDRNDEILTKRKLYSLITGTSITFPFVFLICTMILFIPGIRGIIKYTSILYPVIVILLSVFTGIYIGKIKYERLYTPLTRFNEPKDNEVLIGSLTFNNERRRDIKRMYNKYRIILPIEIFVLVVFTIIVMVLG